MQPFSATEQDLHCGNAIFSRGCMHFISFEAEEKPCWDSVILPPGCPFVSHYVLNLIPFYSHNNSQMKQHNYRNMWSYPFGLSSADLSRDGHMPSQKLKSCIGHQFYGYSVGWVWDKGIQHLGEFTYVPSDQVWDATISIHLIYVFINR